MLEKNKQYFSIIIDDKRIWGIIKGITLPYLPSDLNYVQKQIIMSRNKLPAWSIDIFQITADEKKEFDDAKDDEELAQLVIRDAKKNMCQIVSTEK